MKPVDNLWITRRDYAQKSVDNSMRLTDAVRSCAESERLWPCSSLRRKVLRPVLCLLLGSLFIGMQPAHANNTDHYKLYAHSRLIDYKEFMCFKDIITKENRTWDVKAKNGSHYGLGQMRSKWYRNLDGYRQIDATIKYITKRYGSMCKAWSFHQKRNYY